MKKINWNELTPVCYSIAKHEDKDIGVAADMLAANIRAGNGVHAGSYALGPKYTPDYKALKALWDDCTDEERQGLSHGSRPCGTTTRSSARSGPTSTRASISGAA